MGTGWIDRIEGDPGTLAGAAEPLVDAEGDGAGFVEAVGTGDGLDEESAACALVVRAVAGSASAPAHSRVREVLPNRAIHTG